VKQPKGGKAAVGANSAGEKLAAATAAALADGAPNGNGGAKSAPMSKNARRRIRELEREIEQAETALKALEAELAEPDAWSTPERTQQSTERHAAAKRAVEEAFARWEVAVS
jgi:ATP-binding cassette subfamily F protein 3